MKWRNLPFRMESELVKRWFAATRLRPSSAPFLSGDGYRALTNWRYESDSRSTFSSVRVPEGSVVFCDAWLLEEFLKSVAPKMNPHLTVVSSNGDPSFTVDKLGWIPASVDHLWVQNCDVVDSRVSALPIGLENARLHTNGVVGDFVSLRRGPAPSRNRILWGFSEVTNPVVRSTARRALERCAIADRIVAVNSRAYRRKAAGYRFLASPPGNGLDCHRTWEAFYLRVVPIVLRCVMTERFAALGLPLWLVDSYEELAEETEQTLDARYRQLAGGFSHPALWMDYWKKVIFDRE